MTTNWTTLEKTALTHLQNLIRINTTNPPGNELEAIRYISKILEEAGIPHQIFEPTPGRANLVARIRGSGTKRPLMLTSHVDVVPAENSGWNLPPFSGELKDGFIWGRGAIDMKQMTAMSLALFVEVCQQKIKLPRDLLFVAVCDEEAGCRWGSKWLVENKPELLDAEYALNEVGAFSLYVDGHTFYPIGVAEKGLCWFRIHKKGDPGHGSIPHNNQALPQLGYAAFNLSKKSLCFHKHDVPAQFIRQIAQKISFPQNIILKKLSSSFWNSLILKFFIKDAKKRAAFHALFHNTASPTIFKSGQKINVIPSEASLDVDGRLIPGQTITSFLEEVQKILGPGFELERLSEHEGSEVEHENAFYKTLQQTLIKHDPGATPIPYMNPGFTDAAFYKKLGIKCYGFVPVKLPPALNFSELFHGHNERIPVDGFLFGLKVLWDVICEG